MKTRLLALALAGTCLGSIASAAPVTQADKELADDILRDVVSHRTAKGYGEVPGMVDALAERLKAAGFTDDDIHRVPLTIDGETTMGLVVRYEGSDPSKKPVALLAHMDVVDADPANWNTEPYEMVEKDGYFYGRGVLDNKAGVTLLTTSFIRLKKEGYQPERDLLLAFSGDEETGMQTTNALTKHPLVSEAEFALNSDAGAGVMTKEGEPVAFYMQSAEKTYADFHLTVTNPGGHSATPRKDNAVYALASALTAIEALRFPVQFNEITRGSAKRLAAKEGGEFGEAMLALLEDPQDAHARAAVEERAEYSNMVQTTCVATMLDAGSAPNALPQKAWANVNCRILPGTTVESVKEKIASAIDNPKVEITLDREAVESPVSAPRDDVTTALQNAINANYEGVTVQPVMSSGGTDGREYRSAGIPTYGAGSLAIVRPDDSRAHGQNERLPIVSFHKELLFWDTLLREIGG